MEICAKPPIEEAESASQENAENEMCIVGLDVSLRNTGYCVLGGDDVICGNIQPNGIKGFARNHEILSTFKDKIFNDIERNNRRSIVLIEGYSFGSKHRGQEIAELTGLIKLELWLNFTTYIVPPTVLKKFITGKGNSDKNIMLLKIYKRYGREFTDDNEADAFALAKLGEELLKNPEHELWKKVELLC